MANLTGYDAFIHKFVKRFSNITGIDRSITEDDLWSEAALVFTKLCNDLENGMRLSCDFLTALGRQIEQRFKDIYITAKKKAGDIDRESFVENFATETVRFSKVHFSELPKEYQDLLQNIFEKPEVIGRYIPGTRMNCVGLERYLTKALGWQRKKALELVKTIKKYDAKTVSLSSVAA